MDKVLAVICVMCVALVQGDLKCLSCQKASSIDQCRGLTSCSESEMCFLEVKTDDTLYINAGCRSRSTCRLQEALQSLTSGFGRRRNGNTLLTPLLNCGDCCDTDPDENGPCNNRLCGENQTISHEIKCLSCESHVDKMEDCKNYVTCQDTQVCSNAVHYFNDRKIFYYGCEERHVCLAVMKNNVVQKRQSVTYHGEPLCNSCCYGNHCNAADCYFLRHNTTADSLGKSPQVTVLP